MPVRCLISTLRSLIVPWCCTPHGPAITMPRRRFCSCITASAAMAGITGIIGSIWLTTPTSWQFRSSSPRRHFPNTSGIISAICTTRTAPRTRAQHGRSALTNACSSSCAGKASQPGGAMDCLATQRVVNSSTGWFRLVFARALPSLSAPMPAPMRCRIWRRHGRLASARRMWIPMHCARCSPFASRSWRALRTS